jgi:hypothetical protein
LKPLYAFIASAIILAALAITFPDVLLDPGTLMKGHQKLQKDCLSCHTPFRGVTSVQCITCHKQDAIGIKNVAGALLPADSSKVDFHKGLSANSCADCHTDHKGADAAKAIKPFKHASLTTSLQRNCTGCHKNQMPTDALHRYATGNCSECHSIQKWKPATFNHNQFASGKQCISCHKADRPNDTLHGLSESNCSTCHDTTRWKPATFDHSRYFRLDRNHQASCKTCHTSPGNYKQYTCYNCHEHTPSNMAAVHHEEGISNYQNCIRCHRNGSREGNEGDEGKKDRGDDDD